MSGPSQPAFIQIKDMGGWTYFIRTDCIVGLSLKENGMLSIHLAHDKGTLTVKDEERAAVFQALHLNDPESSKN